ncbi:MAG: M28 family peptidase [Allosphingosinicella sp.]|uniref:M28 family peptidase n=1 Tax=Allosphingosinicella sp. TaxID=2823234 RepID=UPI00394A3C29
MKKLLIAAAAIPGLAFATPPIMPPGPPPSPPPLSEMAPGLRDAALSDDLAWNLIEGLTTEVGPRLAGTEAEARARQWAVARLRELGFANVRVEDFPMQVWVRGAETAEIVAPFPQKLAVTALGRSGATPEAGLAAEVVGFRDLAALAAAPDAAVRGRIVYVGHAMMPTQDGSGYGHFGPVRFAGPGIAARKGAAAIVIRSAGTDRDRRNPHTGMTSWPEGVAAIPAGALSNPDADQLERILARGQPVRMRLALTPRWIGERMSGNVVAEVPGTDPSAGVVLIGGHLDSWDLSPGALDNAAGVGITVAAAKRIMDAGRPRRTIRVVLFGAEEVGVIGGAAYFERHRGAGDVVFVSESDFGADRIWRMDASFDDAARPIADRVAALLGPLGVTRGTAPAGAGADLGAWARDGVAAISLRQDGLRYFDFHHTPEDTLDKVDPAQLRQNVAAWTAMLAVVADAPEPIGRVERPRP